MIASNIQRMAQYMSDVVNCVWFLVVNIIRQSLLMCVRQIWMCGGVLEIATCSHVGHVFRKSTPYSFPGGTSKVVNHNNARLAEVWLDDWKHFYYSINPGQVSSQPLPLPVSLQLPLRAEFVKVNINSVNRAEKLTTISPDNLSCGLSVLSFLIMAVLACHLDNTRSFGCCQVSDKASILKLGVIVDLTEIQ